MDRIEILGVLVDRVTKLEALEESKKFIRAEKSNLIITANAEMIIRAQQDPQLQRIINSAELVIPDGAGVVLAAKLLGNSLKERVAGVDLVKDLLELGSKERYNFYFLGAAPGVAEVAKKNVLRDYPNLRIRIHHGYLNKELELKVLEDIQSESVDILLVGMGVPLQEKWLDHYLDELKISIGIGVGGSFDILAGKKKRAPKLMQNLHLEWLYRLLQEPKRVTRIQSLPKFVYRVLEEKLNRLNKLR